MLRDNTDFIGKHLHGTGGNGGQMEKNRRIVLLLRRNRLVSDIKILREFVDFLIGINDIVRSKRLPVTPLQAFL